MQAIDTLIGDIDPPAALMQTQTERKIAEEQRKAYEVQEAAQTQRQTVGERNVRIVPDVAVSGNGATVGMMDGLMGLMLRQQTEGEKPPVKQN